MDPSIIRTGRAVGENRMIPFDEQGRPARMVLAGRQSTQSETRHKVVFMTRVADGVTGEVRTAPISDPFRIELN